ncbi:MAG: type I restriction endonuclease subunit R [Anaerolineales bacterium]|nr:type I restriction endonuclease subunit R [Anaerolineales bacterium]
MIVFTESVVEDAALDWLRDLGYAVAHGPEIAPGEPASERTSFGDVVLVGRLREALARLNPALPEEARQEALRKVLRPGNPSLVENNRRFHHWLVDGVDVEYRRPDGRLAGDKVWLADFNQPASNDWLAVNQFTVIEGRTARGRAGHHRRPDIVLFLNGLPVAVIELKNAADEDATVRAAFRQLQTYKAEMPSLLAYNAVLIASDGVEARAGSLTADWERFMPWRTVEGDTVAPRGLPDLEVLAKGIFEPARFLNLIRNFAVFERPGEGGQPVKKLAGYHQFHAVNKALDCTLQAASAQGDRRVGVIWHTQGSGKSLTMAFYAGKVIRHPAMANPTLVVLTDRNDLDEQLFGTFAACQDLLRQAPVQAENREHLRALLRVASGGVIFTTIQKFLPEPGEAYPLLSDRRNIVLIADEAHRSQYGFGARVVTPKDGSGAYLTYGFAKHLRDALPNASYIGFTGTPVELGDRSTRAVFGDEIDVYDITRAVEDGATVRIYYEGRLAKLDLDESERPHLDPDFEDVTEGEEAQAKEELKSRWARLEALVGAEKRVRLIARDIVEHFERRTAELEGKGMIVCMSRRICVALYSEIAKLCPTWHDPSDEAGALKVVMTGSAADEADWQPHIRNKARREALARRFKDPADPLKLVIVRDMWLTGFDAPSLHTMYLDKPMRGHGLMQAIARVNRVFKDKPGGLVVDYLGLAHELRQALAAYTQGDQEQTAIPQEQAAAVLREKHEIVAAMFHGFDYGRFVSGTPAERLALIPAGMEHILALPEGKPRYLQATADLARAFALAVPHPDALARRDEIGYFQAVRAAFIKATEPDGHSREDLDSALRQLVSRAVVSDQIVDIFAAAGLSKPDLSILSEEFLAEVRSLPHKNLALEILRKLLSDEIRARSRQNVVQARSFAALLEQTIRAYQNRSIEAAQVISELIELARHMREATERGQAMGLSDDELAFYDALEVNDSAVKILGDETLRAIARELVDTVRRNVTIDWAVRESVRANLRRMVRRVLRKHGYPPDKQEQATATVIEQAEVVAREWA